MLRLADTNPANGLRQDATSLRLEVFDAYRHSPVGRARDKRQADRPQPPRLRGSRLLSKIHSH